MPSETARRWAACISADSRRASESSARPRMNRDIAGAAMDVMITSSARTKISSMSVKPEITLILVRLLVLKLKIEDDDEQEDEHENFISKSFRPTHNIIVRAFLAVRPGGKQVVGIRAVLARIIINISAAPRVGWKLVQIWPVPVLRVGRRYQQILQALREKSVVHLVGAERGFDAAVDVGHRRLHAGALAHPDDARNDQRREDADDGDDQQHFNERESAAQPVFVNNDFFDFDFHKVFYLMYSLMDSTGSNMPMKMTPMKPAIKNSITGSANATAVFRLRSRSVSVSAAMRTSSPSSLPLSSATEIISSTEPGNSDRQSAKLWPSRPPCCTRSMDCATASTKIWLPIERRATFKPCTSGTPAPIKVPSIRQKRAIANCAISGPTSGAFKIEPSQMRLPFSEANQVRTRKNNPTSPAPTSNPSDSIKWLDPV